MNLNDRMIQFRLASRDLYNNYFYSASKEDASELEERYSNILEPLFFNMVTSPEKLQNIEYYEIQENIVAILKNEPHRTFYPIQIEIEQGHWEEVRISNNNSLKLNFECYFDWDELEIKDNRYIRGVITSYSSNEEYIGKNALIEANDAVFQNA